MANRKNTFLLKRSNVVNKSPSLGDIQLGEIALNTADAKLFSTYTGGLTGATEIREIGWDRVKDGVNNGGANEVFSGKSGTDLYFRTISGGTNTTVTTIGDIIKIDSTGDNFYVTGFTYNDANTFTISRNGGLGDLTSTINTVTGLTINGTLVVDTLSATTYTGLTLTDLDDVTSNIPTTPDNTYQGRLLYFDVTNNQWVTGEEYVSTGNVTIWAKKGTAGTIDKGCPVYITGFDNDIHEVELANATTASTMPVIGFTGEDFDNAGVYPLITFGKLVGVDTTSTVSTINPNGETWAVNDVLYMNTTDGGLTKFRPSGTNTQIQRIAKVLKVGSADGQLFIFNTARTAGLPNLTSDYLWVGNGDDKPQEVIRTDVGITTTGFTYNNNNTLTITDDNVGTLSTTINQMSGLTINGTLSATTIDATTILSGGTNLITVIESLDTYVTGGTVSVPATDNTNSGSIGLFYKNSDGTPRTLTFEDTYTTGSTYDNGTALATFTRNDGNSYTLDLSTIDVNDTFSTGGTITQSSSNNDNNQTIQIVGNDGFTPYNITGSTDTFTTGGTYNNGTALITFDKNDGSNYSVDLSTLDLNDTFVTGFTYNDFNTFTISRNDGVELSTLINIMSGLTINGDLIVRDNTTLSGLTTVYGDTPTSAAIRPGLNNTYDLGQPSFRWREIYTTNIDVSNAATIESLIVNGFSDFYETSNFRNGGVNITGNTTQIGNFIITGDTIQNGDVDLTGNVTQLGNYDLVGNLNITGDTTQSGNTITNGTVDIIGSGTGCTLSVTGKTCLDGNLGVTGTVNIGTLGTGTSINTLGIDSNGYVVSGNTTSSDSILISYFNVQNSSLADNITYRLGQMTGLQTSVNAVAHIPLPAGTITEAYIGVYNAGTFASGENITVSFASDGGATTNTLSSTVTATSRHNEFLITGLSIPINAGRTFVNIETPAFATNPTSVQFRVGIKLEL
jgi:hypothetical protein